MNQPILEIKNLHAGVEGKQILKGVDLTINAGEVHAVMGPNGSGKSTLAQVLAGRDLYAVTGGSVIYDGKDLLEMPPEDRAREGPLAEGLKPYLGRRGLAGEAIQPDAGLFRYSAHTLPTASSSS